MWQRLKLLYHWLCTGPTYPIIVYTVIMAAILEPSLATSGTYPCVPPCGCAKHNQTLTIDCSNKELTSFPLDLPLTYKYKLIFTHNKLTKLDVHSYFHRVVYLDLSHNELVEIDRQAIFVLREHLEVLLLHGNQLRHVTRELALTHFEHLKQLTLHQNPLVCDCGAKWLKDWVQNTTCIKHKKDIVCTNRNLYGQPVMFVPDEGFPCKLQALEKATTALRHFGNPVVILIVLILATVFMWVVIFLLYRFCKTSAEIKWVEGAKWTALVETE